jgi:hypothetical protein
VLVRQTGSIALVERELIERICNEAQASIR